LGFVAALQAAEARSLAAHLRARLGLKPAHSRHPTSGKRPEPDELLSCRETLVQPLAETPSLFTGEDMLGVLELFQRLPTRTSGDEEAVTTELPFGDETSLVRFVTGELHPELGRGLWVRLTVPVDFKCPNEPDAVERCLGMNALELSSRVQ